MSTRPTPDRPRSIRLTTGSPERLGEHFTFCIAVRGREDFYDAVELPADYGRGFRVHKEGEPAPYDVNLDGRRSTCECHGFAFRGTCRHLRGLYALVWQGLLPPVGSAPSLESLDREFGPAPLPVVQPRRAG
ncbi:MAG: hypothetical protein JNM56_23235 [Planctomycetia bacterium]|nr:hypothetical protein [Planctomycetia bacterium]